MDQLKESLDKKERELKQILEQAQKMVKTLPDKKLRITKQGNSIQFYVRDKATEDKNHNGKYLKVSERSLANRIAQRDYAKNIVKVVEKQLKLIQNILTQYDENEIHLQYERLSDIRKKLVKPLTMSSEEYVKMWEAAEYENWNQYEENLLFQTNKGELVRSKSEKILADKFGIMNVPYLYEKPLVLGKNVVLHPDFTLLNVERRTEYYWEHFGMMEQEDYCKKALQKLELYAMNGIFPGKNLIITMESKTNPLNMQVVEKQIEEFLLEK
ncbi:MAG: hypothetical protein ACI4F0_06165 [Agathobacter sp.]